MFVSFRFAFLQVTDGGAVASPSAARRSNAHAPRKAARRPAFRGDLRRTCAARPGQSCAPAHNRRGPAAAVSVAGEIEAVTAAAHEGGALCAGAARLVAHLARPALAGVPGGADVV